MNEKCEYDFCAQNKDGICEEVTCTGNVKVHKPEPNESPSSPRTRGSLPASQADSAFEGTGSQLAPVLCPPDPLLSDKPGGDHDCPAKPCDECMECFSNDDLFLQSRPLHAGREHAGNTRDSQRGC